MESKLKVYKTFKGSSEGEKAKAELDFYIQHCQKDVTFMQKLGQFNPELIKDIESYIHDQKRSQSLARDR